MTYTVAKKNLGSARTYSTIGRLASAIMKAGALEVDVHHERGNSHVRVQWPEGAVTYPMDADGNVDQQLAWDMETTP